MNIAYFYMTGEGALLVEKMRGALSGMVFDKTNYKEGVRSQWSKMDALVFVMASGIVVRTIAPFIQSKTTDPAVIVIDQAGRHVISLLSGHLGGANELAIRLAQITGGEAVITTATDVKQVPAMDVVAKENHLKIENIHELKYISSDMVEGKALTIYTMWPLAGRLPDFVRVIQLTDAYLAELEAQWPKITGNRVMMVMPSVYRRLSVLEHSDHVLYLTKPGYCIGTGCKKEMDAVCYEAAFADFVDTQHIDIHDISSLATIELKKDEVCIQSLAKKHELEVKIYSKEVIDGVDFSDASGKVIETSDFVKEITGVGSVSEACAYLGSDEGEIIVGKTKYKGITFALAKETEELKL